MAKNTSAKSRAPKIKLNSWLLPVLVVAAAISAAVMLTAQGRGPTTQDRLDQVSVGGQNPLSILGLVSGPMAAKNLRQIDHAD